MIKTVKDRVWAFDLEWVPDPLAGRLLHEIPASVESPREIMEVMWREGDWRWARVLIENGLPVFPNDLDGGQSAGDPYLDAWIRHLATEAVR